MKPPPFAYFDPTTLEETLALKAQHGLDASVLAGGQSLVPLLSMRLASPETIVDTNRVGELTGLVYDEDGQFRSSTFMDYVIPTAMEVPEFKIGHVETPSPYTEFGIKGGGEGGRMVSPAAISGAIDDALAEYAVRITQLPIKPSEILRQIETHATRG